MVITTICPHLFKVKATEKVLLWMIVKGERNNYVVDEVKHVNVPVPQFLEDLAQAAKTYAIHHQAAEHAIAQYQACRENLPVDHLMLVMDYAPKFHHEPKMGEQNMVYKQSQSNALVVYEQRRPEKGAALETKLHFVVSDEPAQDYVAVHAAFDLLKATTLFHGIKFLHVWFDGAFKGKGLWGMLSALALSLNVPVIFNFWAAGRGRGPWDTASGLFYRALRREINRTGLDCVMTLPDAVAIVRYAKKHLRDVLYATEDAEFPIAVRNYYLLLAAKVAKLRDDYERDMDDLVAITGTLDTMSVRDRDAETVAFRRRSCYACKRCRGFNKFHLCEVAGCGAWQEHKLEKE
jgi:hypothetical protein